jgi:DNA polymerase elongation subunit (family B)
MKFYTNVFIRGDKVYVRGYENGKKIKFQIPYSPYLFVPAKKPTNYKNIHGQYVEKIDFESISSAREFSKQYKDVDGFKIYGLDSYVYTFINDEYSDLEYDFNQISVVSLDIETSATGGFPDPQLAQNPLTAITLRSKGKSVTFGLKPYKVQNENETYFECKHEKELILKFIDTWKILSPDIVTGWNIEIFDIPYLVNRIEKVFDDEIALSLSPWRIIKSREIEGKNNQKKFIKDVYGLAVLDYLELYKKFSYTPQESYKLDNIAQYELGEQKKDYSEYDSLDDFYEKDHQGYIEYNIHDTVLIDKLEDKLKFIEQVCTIAYEAKVNYVDTLTTVRIWDVIIHNYLIKDNIVIDPMRRIGSDTFFIEGAYVKDPYVGFHDWVMSFDLTSLYPHLIMQYNISPETFVEMIPDITVEQILNKELTDDFIKETLIDKNLTMAASGCLFSRDKQGFLPALMEKMYNERAVWKKRMIEYKKKNEIEKSYENEKEIARCNNMQQALKILLNSAYGALGNKYFRWFNQKYAESITKSGQLSIRWVENRINQWLNKSLGTDNYDYVIAADTDSLYLRLDNMVSACFKDTNPPKEKVIAFLDKVGEELNKNFKSFYEDLAVYLNAYSNKMEMKRECIADKAIWTAKKRYILNMYNQEGVSYKEPKLKMMGIEAIRSSTPQVCREKIKQSLKLMMSSNETELQKFIKVFRDDFESMPYTSVAFPRGVNGMKNYADSSTIVSKGTPIHVKGALYYNHLLKQKKLDKKYQLIHDGDKIRFCYLKTPNPYNISVIAALDEMPKEFGLEKYIDYDTQFSKTFLEPLTNILDAINWQAEKKATLEDFFN